MSDGCISLEENEAHAKKVATDFNKQVLQKKPSDKQDSQ